MDVEMMAVAERLVVKFRDHADTTVIRVLTDCLDEHPDADAAFIEQAAKARLAD